MGKSKKDKEKEEKDKKEDKKDKKKKKKPTEKKKKKHKKHRQTPIFFQQPFGGMPTFGGQPSVSSSSSSSSTSSSQEEARELKKLKTGATQVKDLPKTRLQDVLAEIDPGFDSILTAEAVEKTLLQALYVLTRSRPQTALSSFRCTGGWGNALASTQGL